MDLFFYVLFAVRHDRRHLLHRPGETHVIIVVALNPKAYPTAGRTENLSRRPRRPVILHSESTSIIYFPRT